MVAPAPEQVCFLLQLKPGRVQEYLDAHQDVWPEMLKALEQAGWRNYSLFTRAQDGLVVGYFETDDYDAAVAAMARTTVNDRWQVAMADYFETDGRQPDQAMQRLTQYFHLS